MGAKLADLLRYRKEVEIKIDDKVIATRWLRVIGNMDLEDAFKRARIASATIRRILKDENSIEYQVNILPILEAPKEDCIQLITLSRTNQFQNEANVNVERPELPKMEEFAKDPDSPELVEQEKLDEETLKVNLEWEQEKRAYIQQRLNELLTVLQGLDLAEVQRIAIEEQINLVSLATYVEEVRDQKIFRAVYEDKLYTKREYSTVEEFKDTDGRIKNILYDAYDNLEMGVDDIKN